MERSCYIVENISGKTIYLSDLRAEIKPNSTLDLEKVARRIDIERSIDLNTALRQKRLKITRGTHKPKIKIEKQLSEKELKLLIEQTMKTAITESKKHGEVLDISKIQDSIKKQISASINEQIGSAMEPILKAIQSIPNTGNNSGSSNEISPTIDISKIVEITQKGVSNIGSEITESQESDRKTKKIKLNTQAIDMAKELE
jgi:hypothetical protein